jgi:Leucine-rich repeat (LRR) protein
MINLSKALVNNTALIWDVTKDPCSWKGVECSTPGNSFITEISLSGVFLSSSDFLPLLCQIDSLVSLDLSNNELTSIPDKFIIDCGAIGGLQLLNISRNMLGGTLPTFHGFVGLKFLDLSFNSLRGNIRLQLEGLVALKSLNLSNNLFNGPIPTNLGKAMALEQLQLSKNSFEGGIPDQMIDYLDLTLVDLN